VEGMGGEINVSSQLGQGTTFTVSFPMAGWSKILCRSIFLPN
jgi:signal transduction histidine kinase